METWFVRQGEKPFHARQMLRWLHQRGIGEFDQMSDLSKGLRAKLGGLALIEAPALVLERPAPDGTRKFLFDVGGGNAIETVFIPEEARNTLCISTQAGCALECAFCATGRQGFNRNLTVAEIIGQLWQVNRLLEGKEAVKGSESMNGGGGKLKGRTEGLLPPLSSLNASMLNEERWQINGLLPSPAAAASFTGNRISNVVLMGMGEPLANFDNVVAALQIMLDDHAYGLSRRRITVSTAGIVPAMDRLRDLAPVAMAVSLHAPTDALRDQLVPLNRKYPLVELMAACRRYLVSAPRDFITFEYTLIAGVNDAVADAQALVRLVRRHEVPCKFNLIPFNPFAASVFNPPTETAVRRFQNLLIAAGFIATVRKTRGQEIAAACGQLAGKVQDRTRHRRLSAQQALAA